MEPKNNTGEATENMTKDFFDDQDEPMVWWKIAVGGIIFLGSIFGMAILSALI